MSTDRRVCRDCVAEGITTVRDAPYPGPRCNSHRRTALLAKKAKNHATYVTRTYELEDGEYDAILAAQGGVCPLCGKPFVSKRGSLDHDHKIEKTHGMRASLRGIIHAWENTTIGRFGDNPETFERVASYLRNPPARAVLDQRDESA